MKMSKLFFLPSILIVNLTLTSYLTSSLGPTLNLLFPVFCGQGTRTPNLLELQGSEILPVWKTEKPGR
jgi:hypothetical protein